MQPSLPSIGRWLGALVCLISLIGCGAQSATPADSSSAAPAASSAAASTPANSPAASTTAGSAESATMPACAAVSSPIERPGDFPAAFPLPPGTEIVSREDRSGGRMIINAVAPGEVKQTAEFFEQQLPPAGFTIDEGESEPGEAEASFSGTGLRGRWKVNSITDCPGAVTLSVLVGP